jgi:hypothetical protein
VPASPGLAARPAAGNLLTAPPGTWRIASMSRAPERGARLMVPFVEGSPAQGTGCAY